MKKLCVFALTLALTLSMAACGENVETTKPEKTEPPTTTVPATTGPAPTDPAPTDPAPTDPTPTDPAPTDPAPTDPAPTDPAPTDPQTYDVIITSENSEGMIEDWLITGVYAESTFLSEGLELRVLYVLSGSSMTTLRDFWPDDYPYTGAYHDNGDGTFSYDYSLLKPHGQWETCDDDGDVYRKAGGGYPSLPDGSWFFGAVQYSQSFFVVVGNPEAAANGTVPSM